MEGNFSVEKKNLISFASAAREETGGKEDTKEKNSIDE